MNRLLDPFEPHLTAAVQMDDVDPLKDFRTQFSPPIDAIYLDGNSLGAWSQAAETAMEEASQLWKSHAVDGWTHSSSQWYSLVDRTSELMSMLIGAQPTAVTVGASTTVNLHQLLATLYNPSGNRNVIVMDSMAFPSDHYAVQSHVRLLGKVPEQIIRFVKPSINGHLELDQIASTIDTRTSIVLLPSVVYTTGQLLDLQSITTTAHENGAIVGFDCSHSVGVIGHKFDEWGVDFAFWCGYKYLNGGPGAASGLYLNERHWNRLPGIAGWFGSDKSRQFEMASSQIPARGAARLQIGTPNIFSLAPLEATLKTIVAAGIENIRTKSLQQTELLIQTSSKFLVPYGFEVATPPNPLDRGGHIALVHNHAWQICQALKSHNVIPDFRPPNILRLGPNPLYTSFVECVRAIRIISDIASSGEFQNYGAIFSGVT